MSTVKVSTTLDAGRVAEAKARVGERGFSRFMDESLAMRLQWARVDDLERELAAIVAAEALLSTPALILTSDAGGISLLIEGQPEPMVVRVIAV